MHVSDALLDYVQALVRHTRTSPEFTSGLSPRAGLALTQCARAWALIEGRKHVIPEDVQAVIPGVVGHRLAPRGSAGVAPGEMAEQLIRGVAIP